MSAIKNFFTMVDIFGVNYNFRYKDKEKYQTALGGFIVILFVVAAITMAIYYFIPFINRKNYTIVYYTMNLAKTEEVDLFGSQSNFAVGLICEKNKKETKKIEELLDLKSRYVEYVKSRDGSYVKNPKDTNIHLCRAYKLIIVLEIKTLLYKEFMPIKFSHISNLVLLLKIPRKPGQMKY